jgi:hypothetical protein
MKTIIMIIAMSLVLFSCKDSARAQYDALGKHHIITLYAADGKVLGKWESTGSVSNEHQSDGWYFEDLATGKLVEVTGTIVIEVK